MILLQKKRATETTIDALIAEIRNLSGSIATLTSTVQTLSQRVTSLESTSSILIPSPVPPPAPPAPNWVEVSLGDVALGQGKHQEAESHYKRALVCDPINSDAHRGLGDLALIHGNPQVAKGHYKKALECNPNNSSAQRGLEKCNTLK